MNRHLSLKSPAKINWFLHITGRQPNGYHALQTYFQLVDLCDEMTFTTLSTPAITIESNTDIPLEENIIYKAAKLLQPLAPNKGVHIQLNKQIPMGGGLGGGSSNAATTLHALNHLWSLGLSEQDLLTLAPKLGADVAIFVKANASLAEGIGEMLYPHNIEEKWLLLVQPECQVSTKELYSHSDLTRSTPAFKIDTLKTRSSFESSQFKNDFEPLVRNIYTAVENAFTWLNTVGQAHLSGSGGCCFASFDLKEQADASAEKLPKTLKRWVVKSLNQSPLLGELKLNQYTLLE